MARIITGIFKSRVLKLPKSEFVRPSREMVRKAVFDVLGDCVKGKNILDLFSGSGAFGFEALSCGARKAVFVDSMHLCKKIIRENAALLDVEDKCDIICKDVFFVLPRLERLAEKFDIVFADPPYSGNLAKKFLLKIGKYDILLPSAIVVIEHYKKNELPDLCDNLALWQLKKYGDTFVSFYTLNN